MWKVLLLLRLWWWLLLLCDTERMWSLKPYTPQSQCFTFSPRISFRCCWSLRFTSRIRFPCSTMALILSASALRSRRTSSSLLHFRSSWSVTLDKSSVQLSELLAAPDCSWAWAGFSITFTNSVAHSKRPATAELWIRDASGPTQTLCRNVLGSESGDSHSELCMRSV